MTKPVKNPIVHEIFHCTKKLCCILSSHYPFCFYAQDIVFVSTYMIVVLCLATEMKIIVMQSKKQRNWVGSELNWALTSFWPSRGCLVFTLSPCRPSSTTLVWGKASTHSYILGINMGFSKMWMHPRHFISHLSITSSKPQEWAV